MVILVRYGELALKSHRVRRRFEEKLMKNIVNALHEKNIDCIVSSKRGRIYVHTNDEEDSIQFLKRIFGIVSVSISIETTSNLDDICKISVESSKKLLKKNQTFAVRVRRTGSHKFSSQEAAVIIGKEILDNNDCSVNLTKPDIIIFVEIRDNKSYIYSEKVSCSGGFPVGTQGRIISLISDKNSITASWLIMKRGCNIIPIIFKNTDVELLEILKNWGSILKQRKLQFDDMNNIDNLEMLCNEINKIIHEAQADALVINEKKPEECNFKVDDYIDVPIFRPLIGMTDKEIEELSQKIGIYS